MAIARTQTATIKTQTVLSGSSLTSNALTTVAGRSLFVAVSCGAGTPAFGAVTDSKGDAWVKQVEQVNGSLRVMICSCLAPATVGSSHTVSVVFTNGGDGAIAFCEYSGLDVAAALAASNSNTGTGTAVTTGAAAPAGTCLYLVAENNGGSPTITPNSPWGQVSENESGSSAQPLNLSELLDATGSRNGDWTLGSSQAWVAVIAAFAAAAKAVPPFRRRRFFDRKAG